MKLKNDFRNFLPPFKSVFVLTLFVAVITPIIPSHSANQVDLGVSGDYLDTLSVYQSASFDFWIENDIVLGGLSLGFKIWSPDGATWSWQPMCPQGIVCPFPGSRADEDIIFYPINIDESSIDTFMIGGVFMFSLPVGPMEPLYQAHFQPGGSGGDDSWVGTLCIDSCFVPPSGAFVFVDQFGAAFPPEAVWSYGGRCWPVGSPHFCHAEWDYGAPSSVSISYCDTAQVTLSATNPEDLSIRFQLNNVINGGGTAQVIDNGDNTCDVSYIPVPSDVGVNIIVVVDVACEMTEYGISPPYNLDVEVTNSTPVADCGFFYNWGATFNTIIKDDFAATDADPCAQLVYSLLSGPGQMDPITGVYTWTPQADDTGGYIIEYAVTDGVETIEDHFQLGITDQNCCPGDANYTGSADIADVVHLVNFIFKGGNRPIIMNWADPNADCEINVGDCVFLINYIFNSGPAPQVGCYYPW